MRRSGSLIGAAVFLAALAGCAKKSAQTQGGMHAMPVAMQALEPQQVEDAATYTSTLKSRNSSTVQPQVEGVITKIFARSGQQVRAGVALMQIDPLKEEATAASQEASYKAKVADMIYAKQQLERTQQLYDAGVTSKQDLESAQDAYNADVAQVNALKAQSQSERVQLHYYLVTAPSSGIVGDIPVHVGDRVTTSTTLTTVDQPGALEAYVQVPVERSADLGLGKTVQIEGNDGGKLGEGKITFVSPAVDPQTQTILVKAEIPNPKGVLRNNETVQARVIFGAHPGLLVPVLAVSQINGQAFVFVAQPAANGFLSHEQEIQVGEIQGNNYVVKSGLQPGDRLITSGLAMMSDGMPVVPMGQENGPASNKG